MQAVLFIFAIFVAICNCLPEKKITIPVPKIDVRHKPIVHEHAVHHNERVVLRQEEPVVRIKQVPIVKTRTVVRKRPVVFRQPKAVRKDIFITKRIHVPKPMPRPVEYPVYVDKVHTVVRKVPKKVPYDVVRKVMKPIIRRVQKPFDVVKRVFKKVTVHKPYVVDVPQYRKVPHHNPVDVIKKEPYEVVNKIEKPVPMEVVQHVPVVQKEFVKVRQPVHITKHFKHGVVLPNPVPIVVNQKVDIPYPFPANKGPIHVTDHTHGVRIRSKVLSRQTVRTGSFDTSGTIVGSSVSTGPASAGSAGIQPGSQRVILTDTDNGIIGGSEDSDNGNGDNGDGGIPGVGIVEPASAGVSVVDPADSNPCANSPCLNGGSCTRRGQNSFMCMCTDNFSGLTCDMMTSANGGSVNGGSTSRLEIDGFQSELPTNGNGASGVSINGRGTNRLEIDGFQRVLPSSGNVQIMSSGNGYLSRSSSMTSYQPGGRVYFNKNGKKMVVYGHNKYGMPMGKMA